MNTSTQLKEIVPHRIPHLTMQVPITSYSNMRPRITYRGANFEDGEYYSQSNKTA